jgi:hypothetical protein
MRKRDSNHYVNINGYLRVHIGGHEILLILDGFK